VNVELAVEALNVFFNQANVQPVGIGAGPTSFGPTSTTTRSPL
jgi:hypothetical protein